MGKDILEIFDQFPRKKGLQDPYIIAEVGVNHEGDMELAKRMITEASHAGADAVKFQTYKADRLASKHSPAYWDTSKEGSLSQYKLFKKYDKFWEGEMLELKEYCDAHNVDFMSTPFDVESANFINNLVDVHKISSSDITNKPFIELICSFGKPIILSTGASHLDEIKEAVDWMRGCQVALLHCILNYPTTDNNANLGMILGLQDKFPDKLIGYSDHTLPSDMKTCEIATLLGSVIIEKHFTHDKTLKGNDHYHAMDKNDLSCFRKNIDRVFSMLGSFEVHSIPSEELARKNARRSLVALRDIAKNSIIKVDDLTFKRPAFGISPKDIDMVIGKRASIDIRADDIITKEMVK